MKHTGQWVQKGFTYLTGPTQTTMVISIRNNAPGGGGNDWAIDDVGVSSCIPSMTLTPNKPDTLCQGADDTVRFKVSAFFNNYTQWRLEKSINNGVTWTYDLFATLTDGHKLKLLSGFNDPTEPRLIEQRIESHLRIANQPVVGEYRG